MFLKRLASVSLKLLEAGYKNESLHLLQASSQQSLPKKGKRYKFFITGNDQGDWDLSQRFDFGAMKAGKWVATASLSSKNDWKTLAVENATEHHRGLQKAFKEIIGLYPELQEWVISFDGSYKPISEVFSIKSAPGVEIDWSKIDFFHGTSLWAWEQIKKTGLLPREESGVSSAYGKGVSAPQGRKDAVYLTTQDTLARWAARDAARNAQKEGKSEDSIGVILLIPGKYLNPRYIISDEDSQTTDPAESLEKMGSIAYKNKIPPRAIQLAHKLKY